MELSYTDWITITVYFATVFYIGFYFARQKRDSHQYFLAGHKTKWFALGTSVFATNISSEHFIGLAGSGAAMGLAVGAYEWGAAFCLFVLGWVFIPYYLKSKVFTMPEFLERRFNPECRWYLTSVSVVAYIFTKISVSLFAGAILLKAVAGWDYLTSATLLVIATGVYTIAGGLAAVIYTDLVQAFILIGGSVILTLVGLDQIGGFAGLREVLPPDFFHMIKPADHSVYPWPGTTLGVLILGIWYWGTDQFIVQKVLSAKNLNHARAGTNFTALLKILPIFILILPGLIARALWPAEVGAAPDQAYPLMVTRLMPAGIAGLMIAALLAALMSSLSSVFNSCSTLITMDIYRKFRPDATENRLVFVGKLFTGIIVLISIVWIPIIPFLSDQIYQYLQSIQAYVSPPITAVFLVGVLWKGATGRAAFVTLLTGGVLGAFRFVLDVLIKAGGFNPGIFSGFANMAFLNYCVVMFFFCVFLMIVVSNYTPRPSESQIRDKTFDKSTINTGIEPVWKWVHAAMTIVIGLTIIGFWIHFA